MPKLSLIQMLKEKCFKKTSHLNTFKQRLEAIDYRGSFPTYCIDDITFDLMENPVKINNFEAHTVDQSTIANLKPIDKTIRNPFNNAIITSRQTNTERKEKIEAFVSGLEKIAVIEKELESFESGMSELKHQLTQETELTQNEIDDIINEQSKQLIEATLPIKLYLLETLQIFIKTIEDEINKEDKIDSEKDEEINDVLGEKKLLVTILEKELLAYQAEISPCFKTTVNKKWPLFDFFSSISKHPTNVTPYRTGLWFYPTNSNNNNDNNEEPHQTRRWSREMD